MRPLGSAKASRPLGTSCRRFIDPTSHNAGVLEMRLPLPAADGRAWQELGPELVY